MGFQKGNKAASGKNKKGLPKGRIPKVLERLTADDIYKAGLDGIEAETFLQSVGAKDEEIPRCLIFDKWASNYRKGYAEYKMRMQRAINKAVIEGDRTLAKLVAEKKLGYDQMKGDDNVTIVGDVPEFMKSKVKK